MKKTLIICSIAFGLLCIGLVVYYLIPKAYIQFIIAPDQVNITIDNTNKRSVKADEIITISPGHHTITLLRDEFDPFTKEIDVKNSETIQFLAVLNPLTDAARELLNSDTSKPAMNVQGQVNYDKGFDDMMAKNPILSILPIEGQLYSIDSCPATDTTSDKIALCINSSDPSIKIDILDDVRRLGYNPEDYEIIWTNEIYRG